MSEEILIQDLSSESLMVGAIVNNPTILDEYMTLISPDYDFSDLTLRMLYNLFVKAYMENTVVNETSINIELAKMTEEEQQTYKKAGGYKVYQRLANIAKVQEDFKKIYEKVKTYNVLRYLREKGFPVEKNLDKLKDKSVDYILKAYELQLAKTFSFIQNINDGARIGDDIEEFYARLKDSPDVGIDIGFPLISHLIRGWRNKTIGAVCLNSGHGKSRTLAYMMSKIAIVDQIPVVMIINEMNIDEMNSIILVTIANMVFSKQYGGITIEEEEITRGILTGKKDEMVKAAAKYIKERSKLIVHQAEIWDINSLKMLMRKYQLRDKAQKFVIDTMKPYFDPARGSSGVEWQDFARTVENLKEYCRQMDIGIIMALQLTDSVLQTGELNSNSLSNSKHVYHHADWMLMARKIKYKEKEKFQIKLEKEGNPFNGELIDMSIKDEYYLYRLVKNRAGKSNVDIVIKTDKGRMLYDEQGYMVFKKEE